MGNRYRAKLGEITALRWTGENFEELSAFVGGHACNGSSGKPFLFGSESGNFFVALGDYVVKTGKGDFFICCPSSFDSCYEKLPSKGILR